ncbi:MAG: UDP-N-acetylmuramoyl-L-alanine--D-glutamate ligase [Armatimonas sp.]
MKVGVIGLAATGIATARALARRGVSVVVLDAKPLEQLSADSIAALEANGVEVLAGTTALPTDITRVIPSPGVPESAPPLVEARERGLDVISEIELAYELSKAPIAAVTGTNGKTTTTAMLGAICRAAGRETRVCGNIAEDNGVRTPLIQAADDAPENAILVAELSSFQLAQTRTFRPKVAAWLNLTVDHMDRYESLGAYAADKAKILANQQESDTAVLNADDPMVVRFAEDCGKGRRDWFSGNNPPERKLLVPGKHNLANADAAARMARALGIDDATINAALAAFPGVAHRMERVGESGGVVWINNSMCTNPAAVAASLDACEGGIIAICGGKHKGGDLTEMTAALAQKARRVLLIGDAAEALSEALSGQGYSAFTITGTLECAVAEATKVALTGETVILVPGCASFDQFNSFEHRGQVFRDLVRARG